MGARLRTKKVDSALCTLQKNCISLGAGRMWEHAGLICFILDAHRSVLPTKLLHSTTRPVKWSAQCVGIVPATTEASVLLSHPALQPTSRLCMSVVSAILQPPRQSTCFCPPRSLQTLSLSPLSRWQQDTGTLYLIATVAGHEHH